MAPTEKYPGTKCNAVAFIVLIFNFSSFCSECICAAVYCYTSVFTLLYLQHATVLVVGHLTESK